MVLIGPLNAIHVVFHFRTGQLQCIPRVFQVSFFSIVACLIIFAATVRKIV